MMIQTCRLDKRRGHSPLTLGGNSPQSVAFRSVAGKSLPNVAKDSFSTDSHESAFRCLPDPCHASCCLFDGHYFGGWATPMGARMGYRRLMHHSSPSPCCDGCTGFSVGEAAASWPAAESASSSSSSACAAASIFAIATTLS